MQEITITTNRMNHLIDPYLSIWGWEVPVYLFFGGLAAGILLITSWAHLKNKTNYHAAYYKIIMWGPIVLSVGMGALFLDLENKLNVLRFYGSFQITSPMSWGSWILMLYYPASIILTLATLQKAYPQIYNLVLNIPFMDKAVEISKSLQGSVAKIGIPIGISLGIYTGVLLSAYVARPFWNSAILGPLFLVSGFSSALALTILLSKNKDEEIFFTKLDLYTLVTEILFIGLFIVGHLTSSLIKLKSLDFIMGGEYTLEFWILFVSLGVLLPFILEIFELNKRKFPKYITPMLVLYGGLMFRFVMVSVGQHSSWMTY